MKYRIVGLASTLLFTQGASAAEPYYFNKPGVARDVYAADVGECAELAGGVRVRSTPVYAPNLYATAAAALFSGLMKGAEERRLEGAVERTCMADKGYKRLAIDRDALRSVRGLDGQARLDRLFELAAATAPIGKELPE